MEGFMVDTTNLNNCANDIQGYGDRIKDLKDSVRSIRLGMRHKLSAREQIDRTLRGIEDRMLDEAALMSSLDQALEHIAETYRSTERKLVTEGIRRSTGGQAVTEQQQAMMDQYMQAAIFDILQEDQFSQEAWANASIEERKEILDRFLDRMEKEMGISLEDIQFRSGERVDYNGAYDHADNHIVLNESLLSGDPNVVMTTLMHETRHAYQHAACENPEQFLVAEGTIQDWQDSFDHYQDYLEQGDYYRIASEADAMGFAGQEQRVGEKVYFSDLGNGREALMYDKTYSIGQYAKTTVTGGWRSSVEGLTGSYTETESFIMEYGLKCVNDGLLYDEYRGVIDGEEKTFYIGKTKLTYGIKEGGRVFGEKVTLERDMGQPVKYIAKDERDLSFNSKSSGPVKGNTAEGLFDYCLGASGISESYETLERGLDKMPDNALKRTIKIESGLNAYNAIESGSRKILKKYDAAGGDMSKEALSAAKDGLVEVGTDRVRATVETEMKTAKRKMGNDLLRHIFGDLIGDVADQVR